jgi:hypothetical protein
VSEYLQTVQELSEYQTVSEYSDSKLSKELISKLSVEFQKSYILLTIFTFLAESRNLCLAALLKKRGFPFWIERRLQRIRYLAPFRHFRYITGTQHSQVTADKFDITGLE